MKMKAKGRITPYLFLTPYYFIFLVFIILPVLVAVGLSFTNFNTIQFPDFVGFKNYIDLFLQDATFMKNVVPMIDAAISRAGLERRVTSVRTLNMPVLELQDHEKLMTNLYQECKKAIEEDHVSVLVMGCTGIVGINAEMVNRLRKDGYDIPVLEAAQCAMTLLELYAKMGLYQSRETYMEPPKKG